MTVGLQVPGWVQRDDPLFVLGASPRSGTTLLQRLANSSGDVAVFGENLHFMQDLPKMISVLLTNHLQHGEVFERARAKFANETTDFWSNALWPDSKRYALMCVSYFYDLVRVYKEAAVGLKRRRWGVKQPLYAAATFQQLKDLMPNARFLFVFRNIYDAIRSAKGRGFITGPADCADYAKKWEDTLLGVLGEPACSRVLTIRYEDFVAKPEEHIAGIEQFAGISGINREIVGRKINTWTGTGQGHSPTGYVAPQDLSESEVEAIRAAAPRALESTRYVPERSEAA